MLNFTSFPNAIRVSTTQDDGQQDKRVTSVVHDYTEIPNFLEECGTTVYQNTSGNGSTKPGYYDDVLPDPSRSVHRQNIKEDRGNGSAKPGYYDDILPDLSRSVRRHSYDKVMDDVSSDYHRLQHNGSGINPLSPGSESKVKSLESSHHRINIYEEEVRSQSSEEDYHHLDRRATTAIPLTTVACSKRSSTSTAHDEAEASEEARYSQIYPKAAPIGAVGRLPQQVEDEEQLPEASEEARYSQIYPKAAPISAVGRLPQQVEDEEQLPEVKQYESLYRSLSQDRDRQFSISGSGSASISSHSKSHDEVPQDVTETKLLEFESLYSPLSEFGVVIAKAEDCGTEKSTETAPSEEYSQINTWVDFRAPKREESINVGSISSYPGDNPSREHEATPQCSVTPSDKASYYNHMEPQQIRDEEGSSKSLLVNGGGCGQTDTQQSSPAAADGDYSHLELEFPIHNYTPILPNQRNTPEVYNVPIVSTSELYQSEKGHIYRVLETP